MTDLHSSRLVIRHDSSLCALTPVGAVSAVPGEAQTLYARFDNEGFDDEGFHG